MARSQIGRLRAIEQKEARARELLKQVQKEREKVIAPTRAKIEGVFGRVLTEVIRERLEAIVCLRLNQGALEKDLREVLERHLPLREQKNRDKKSAEIAAAAEEDELSFQIMGVLDSVGETEESSASQS